MLKYVDIKVTFSEIPNEISLCINISGCPNRCEGCHSPYLQEDTGEELTEEKLVNIIESNNGISCICFMGGDQAPHTIIKLARLVKVAYPELKTAWYSGKDVLSYCVKKSLQDFDYIKIGPYIKEKGPLTSKTTNQCLYAIHTFPNGVTSMLDITHLFWKYDREDS